MRVKIRHRKKCAGHPFGEQLDVAHNEATSNGLEKQPNPCIATAEADERDYDTAGGGTSLSTVVMRAGRHYAQFTVADPEDSTFGVMRPGWVRNATPRRDEVYNVGGHCFYEAESGDGWPSDAESNPVHDWEGAEEASEGDRIGLLLDLDHGSMNVYKNDELLGVMCESGLGGEYCWAAQVQGEIGASVRIDPAMVPA